MPDMYSIDFSKWQKALRCPDWYLQVQPDLEWLEAHQATMPPVDYQAIKQTIYNLVEQAIQASSLPLAGTGDNLDVERQPVDMVVVHHTKNSPGMTLSRLNAIQLLRIYGRYYANPTDSREKNFKGRPVWSGHFYDGRQVFWGYHYLIRRDGQVERLLPDNTIGWQAGNWEINRRSIGVCFDDDLSDAAPSMASLQAAAELISSYHIKPANIIGHSTANQHTQCPGQRFETVWRPKLLQLLKA